MKCFISLLTTIIFALFASISLSNCTKNCDCDSTKEIHLKNLISDGHDVAFRTGQYGVKFTFASNNDLDVNSSIVDLLRSLNVKTDDYNFPVGAAFYLEDTLLSNSNILDANPMAFLLYDKIDGRVFAKYFKLQDGEYIFVPTFMGVTSIFSETDIIDLMNLNFLSANEILTIGDLSVLNKSIYISDFQKLIQKGLNSDSYVLSGGRPSAGCKEADPGCTLSNEGYCIPQERQNGPVGYFCLPTDDKCVREQEDTKSVLIEAGEESPQTTNQKLYAIRDDVLSLSIKGKKYIDDYYYCSMLFDKESVSLEIDWAIEIVGLIQTDFLYTLSEFYSSKNDFVVLIPDSIKDKLHSILEKSKSISNDERFQSIITNLENDVDLYAGKSIIEIRNDF